MRSIEDMIQQEIMCCMSSLVATLANGYGNTSPSAKDLADLTEQAFELSAPIDDYEEAAIQAGYSSRFADGMTQTFHTRDINEIITEHEGPANHETWSELADHVDNIEPYAREVFEHWAVTQWLAKKLIEQGERVDTDFAGLNVWARATTGQAISADGVIERIYAATHKAD